MMTMMIKDPEQLLAAAEVLKIAGELRRDRWEKEKAANPQLNAIAWSEQNDPFQFIEPAYRNLVAVAAHIQAIQGKDHGEASMRQIDAMLDRSAKRFEERQQSTAASGDGTGTPSE